MNPAEGGGDPAEYGDRIADVYDEWHGERDDVGPVVEFLAGWEQHPFTSAGRSHVSVWLTPIAQSLTGPGPG